VYCECGQGDSASNHAFFSPVLLCRFVRSSHRSHRPALHPGAKEILDYKAFKFRLWTKANQERKLGIALEAHRRLYNLALAQRRWFYEEWQIARSYSDQSAWFKELPTAFAGLRDRSL
jgi:hypothetical protein